MAVLVERSVVRDRRRHGPFLRRGRVAPAARGTWRTGGGGVRQRYDRSRIVTPGSASGGGWCPRPSRSRRRSRPPRPPPSPSDPLMRQPPAPRSCRARRTAPRAAPRPSWRRWPAGAGRGSPDKSGRSRRRWPASRPASRARQAHLLLRPVSPSAHVP
jgi:hypothetical protein